MQHNAIRELYSKALFQQVGESVAKVVLRYLPYEMMDGGMVDVTGKPRAFREAIAEGRIRLRKETLRLIREGRVRKGDVFTTARVAGVMACKRTSEIIPLCHPIPITYVNVYFEVEELDVVARAHVKTRAETGVEMEALTAVMASLLTIWDMVKEYEKDSRGQYPETTIHSVKVLRKIREGEQH